MKTKIIKRIITKGDKWNYFFIKVEGNKATQLMVDKVDKTITGVMLTTTHKNVIKTKLKDKSYGICLVEMYDNFMEQALKFVGV